MWANWNCLSLVTSHVFGTSRAEHTTSYRGRATTSFKSYHQLKTYYLKTINLNLGRRCRQTEIVCHWSLLMLLELTEQSIQLLKCHTSRWRLCHGSPQDNQSKSWKSVASIFFCHWSLLMPFAPAGQSIQLLICHVSRWRLFSSFTARQPIQISGKDVTSGFFVTGDGVYDTWEQFIAGVHKAGNIF